MKKYCRNYFYLIYRAHINLNVQIRYEAILHLQILFSSIIVYYSNLHLLEQPNREQFYNEESHT